MHGGARTALSALLVGVLLAGCAARRQPIVLIEATEPGQPPALRVAQFALGEDLYWQLKDGERGVGKLLSFEADTLVLVEWPGEAASTGRAGADARFGAGRLRRIARCDLVGLSRWDPQATPYVAGVIAAPVVLLALILVLLAIDPPTWGVN